MKYKNPIPSVDDEQVSKKYSLVFTFHENVTIEEATGGINQLLEENGGKIRQEWIHMGEPKEMRYALPQN